MWLVILIPSLIEPLKFALILGEPRVQVAVALLDQRDVRVQVGQIFAAFNGASAAAANLARRACGVHVAVAGFEDGLVELKQCTHQVHVVGPEELALS